MEHVEARESRALGKILSILLRAVYAIGVLIYVAFYTEGFTLFQQFVVLLVALIIYGTAESILRVLRRGKSTWRW